MDYKDRFINPQKYTKKPWKSGMEQLAELAHQKADIAKVVVGEGEYIYRDR